MPPARPTNVPTGPGSYQFRDGLGRVIYVGKAANLRSRVASYFQDPARLHPRTAAMVEAAASVEWIEVRNEVEALMLEFSLIKEHRPRFNVRLRDDKSYPYLMVTTDEEWPRASVMRGRKRKGATYFGPFAHAWAIRDTLDLLLRTMPVRTCSQSKFDEHARLGRPCLLYHIEKCSGPCVGAVDAAAYAAHVGELCRFLGGETDAVVERLGTEMSAAAAALDFESAARIRDRLASVGRAVEKQQMVGETDEDFDIVGLVEDDLEASVQVFFVRHGRVVGRRGFLVDKVEDLAPGRLVERVLEELYSDDPPLGVPRTVYVPTVPAGQEAQEDWLAQVRGAPVSVRVPRRGAKRGLQEVVARNAQDEFTRHRMRRASDHNARSRALSELQECLGLPAAPLRIECYDMAHLQGSDYVGSMVVMEDGLAVPREYRRFKVTPGGNDDYAAMREVLTRRLAAYLDSRESVRPEGARPQKFSYPPHLIVVDGGKGQLAVADAVLHELGLAGEIPVAALAKRFEEVFVPGRPDPVVIPRGSEALYMLQRIRDEAHRFANSFHRQLRAKRMVSSSLEGIAGLGEVRARRLVKELGGVTAVKRATRGDLEGLTWLPAAVADAVHERFHPAAPRGDAPGGGRDGK